MEFSLLSISLLIVASALVILGASLLIARDWFLQFARGFCGFGLIFLAFFFIMLGLNIGSYMQVKDGQAIGSVSFVKLTDQSFEVSVSNVQNSELVKYRLQGDTWCVESAVLRPSFKSIKPFYRLKGFYSRYYSLEQERLSGGKEIAIQGKIIGIDILSFFNIIRILPVSAGVVKSNFVPMADGAVYSVVTSVDGLIINPVNAEAITISKEWQ